ncbi:MAG: hypothetical protein M3Z41_04660 [Candidatus Eremiobacteraeota bacterium]|nr:hypothetical protein [Candidatus Eremiobacteraeota bacterium]
MRRDDAAVAGLTGMIAGTIGHQTVGALVSAPLWMMAGVTSLFAWALWHTRMRGAGARILWAVTAGLCVGLTLPAYPPPARTPILTHAVARAHAGPDARLFAALDVLDDHPQALLGQRIAVTGTWRPRHGLSLGSVSRRVMACCAADAVDVGFDVVPKAQVPLAAGSSVLVSGIVHASLLDGETRYALTDASVAPISAGNSAAK